MKALTTAVKTQVMTDFFDPPEERKQIEEWLGAPPESYLLVGHPGSGKSTLAATYPGLYVLSADNKGAGLAKEYKERTRTFKHGENVHETVMSILYTIRDNYQIAIDNGIKTIVVDTMTAYCEYLEVEILNDAVLNHKGTVMLQIQHYGIIGNRISEMIRVAKEVGVNLVCIAHIDDSQENEDGYTVWHPNLSGRKIEAKVPGKFDHVVLLRNTEGEFTAQVKPSTIFPHAKLAMPPTLYKTAPNVVPSLTYKRLRGVIDGKIKKKEAKK